MSEQTVKTLTTTVRQSAVDSKADDGDDPRLTCRRLINAKCMSTAPATVLAR